MVHLAKSRASKFVRRPPDLSVLRLIHNSLAKSKTNKRTLDPGMEANAAHLKVAPT